MPTIDELERNRLEHEMNVENASLELVGANETIEALNRSANEMVVNMNQTVRDLTINRAAVESMRANVLDVNELDLSHDWELKEDASNYHEQRHKLWEEREKVRELWEKYQDEEVKAYYETLLELEQAYDLFGARMDDAMRQARECDEAQERARAILSPPQNRSLDQINRPIDIINTLAPPIIINIEPEDQQKIIQSMLERSQEELEEILNDINKTFDDSLREHLDDNDQVRIIDYDTDPNEVLQNVSQPGGTPTPTPPPAPTTTSP